MVGGVQGVIFIVSDFEITVDKLVYGGAGLGRLDGRAVLVPFVLPGERVRVRAASEKPGLMHADSARSPGGLARPDCAGLPLFLVLRRMPLPARAV